MRRFHPRGGRRSVGYRPAGNFSQVLYRQRHPEETGQVLAITSENRCLRPACRLARALVVAPHHRAKAAAEGVYALEAGIEHLDGTHLTRPDEGGGTTGAGAHVKADPHGGDASSAGPAVTGHYTEWMSRLDARARNTFRSLRVRNYRLYFFGQIISVSGTWMQTVAQAWLVLRLTGSGVDLGTVVALQFLPMLLLGAWGGLVADRLDKRRLLYATQTSAGLLALALGLLVGTGSVDLAEVYLLAGLLGVVNLFDNPARQTFVMEMVGPDDVANAVSLNSVVMNAARVIGPALAGLLISLAGMAVCFDANAASYIAVIIALAMMRHGELHRTDPVVRAKGQLRDGFRYVWRTPGLRDPLLMMAVVGTLAFNFQVTLALFAKFTFHGGAGTYALLTSLMGGGAVLGGLVVANRAEPTTRVLAMIGMAFGVLVAAVAVAPDLLGASLLIVPMGGLSIAFIATANATLQLRAEPSMRGRVMALYAVAFLGTTPVGGPLVGWIAEVAGPRASLLVGAGATMAAAGWMWFRHRQAAAGSGERLRLPGKPEHPFADDVALDLGGPAPNSL
jgi:MFS family permease